MNNVLNIMLICRERDGRLYQIKDDIHPDKHMTLDEASEIFEELKLRSRMNPGLYYYLVNCHTFIKNGVTIDTIWNMIYSICKDGKDPAEEFRFVERI